MSVSKSKRNRTGRPPKAPEDRRTKRLNVTPSLLAALDKRRDRFADAWYDAAKAQGGMFHRATTGRAGKAVSRAEHRKFIRKQYCHNDQIVDILKTLVIAENPTSKMAIVNTDEYLANAVNVLSEEFQAFADQLTDPIIREILTRDPDVVRRFVEEVLTKHGLQRVSVQLTPEPPSALAKSTVN